MAMEITVECSECNGVGMLEYSTFWGYKDKVCGGCLGDKTVTFIDPILYCDEEVKIEYPTVKEWRLVNDRTT